MTSRNNYDDDDDEELGAYIYRTSHTAKLFREMGGEKEAFVLASSSRRKSPLVLATKSEEHIRTTVEPVTNNTDGSIKRTKCKRESVVLKEQHVKRKRTKLWLNDDILSNSPHTSGRNDDSTITTGTKRKNSPVQDEKNKKKVHKRCSNEGCTNYVVQGGVCIKHGAKRPPPKICSYEGCANYDQKGGVCIRHGAKGTKLECIHEGCTNQAKKEGVCFRHGAPIKLCSHEGCTNQAKQKGVCRRHGATVRRCSHEGCTNHAIKGGVCIRHGAKRKTCSHEGCTNIVQKGKVCIRHGAKKKKYICSNEECTNNAIQGGVCRRHGAIARRCSHEGCTNNAVQRGLCRRHGATRKKHWCQLQR